MNADILEEEQSFPYEGISLEEARIFRYLMGNILPLKNGKIVRMYLVKTSDFSVNANGLYYEIDPVTNKELNKSFNSEIDVEEDKVTIYSEVTLEYEPGYKKRDVFSIDEFVMEKDSITVKSKLERQDAVVTNIPYYEEEKARMR